jgi:hypothetical protein
LTSTNWDLTIKNIHLTINNLNTNQTLGFTLRVTIQKGEKTLKHLQLTTVPGFGVPKNIEGVTKSMLLLQSIMFMLEWARTQGQKLFAFAT